jgi:chloramphenicol-sensitive protein RarD
MQTDSDEPRGQAAGLICYTLWGLLPLLFHAAARAGASPFEIVAWRAIWSLPLALLLVILVGRGAGLRALATAPKELRALLVSALLIGCNWSLYVWAVDNGQTISASLGYYINPLLNMLVGAVLFGERIDRSGQVAIALAAIGVTIQGAALGTFPWVSLLLGSSFCAYGVVHKKIRADPQTGLLVECAILLLPAVAYALWLEHAGVGVFGRRGEATALLLFCGPATVIPLVAFAFAAQRVKLTVLGFMQFVSPTLQFAIGLTDGETVTPLSAASFLFIWAGVAVFALGVRRRMLATTRHPILLED